MIKRLATELRFVYSHAPLPTLDLEMDSLPTSYFLGPHLLADILRPIASASPNMVATLYQYDDYSDHFGNNTAFFAVAGSAELLPILVDVLTQSAGVKVRGCVRTAPPSVLAQYHLQDGRVWCPHDFLHWSSSAESVEAIEGQFFTLEDMDALNERRQRKAQALTRLCRHFGVSEGLLIEKLILDAQANVTGRLDAEQCLAYVSEDAAHPDECHLRRGAL